MTEIIVTSRRGAEKYNPDGKSIAIISITSPAYGKADIGCSPVDILRLEFHDIAWEDPGYSMTDKQAEKVADFVEKWWGKVDILLVHCEAGISRSAGTAAAISKVKTGDDMYYFTSPLYAPNPLCYRKVYQKMTGDNPKRYFAEPRRFKFYDALYIPMEDLD